MSTLRKTALTSYDIIRRLLAEDRRLEDAARRQKQNRKVRVKA
jgi:hypothetical protein